MPLGFLMNMTFLELFKHGGYIMWPIILLSFLTFTVIVERILFIIREISARDSQIVEQMLEKVEAGDADGAIALGRKSQDFVARTLVYALSHRGHGFSNALIRASNQELSRFQQGIPILDMAIPVAQLLGLLGTVTGMMRTFGALGEGDITTNAGAILAGVGEALIAVACGLFIAICAMLPFNYLNTRYEQARNEIADAANALELIFKKNTTGVSH